MDEIVNKVAQSGIITIDLSEFISEKNIAEIDIAPVLWQGLVLKEKSFREYIQNTDWSEYSGKDIAVFCSADAIIPSWAYMLLATALHPFANEVVYGNKTELIQSLLLSKISVLNQDDFKDARVIIKGCSEFELSPSVYVAITTRLLPVVKSLMFGEPCSTVPVYKRR